MKFGETSIAEVEINISGEDGGKVMEFKWHVTATC